MPQIHTVERVVEVPQIQVQEILKEVPMIHIQEKINEVNIPMELPTGGSVEARAQYSYAAPQQVQAASPVVMHGEAVTTMRMLPQHEAQMLQQQGALMSEPVMMQQGAQQVLSYQGPPQMMQAQQVTTYAAPQTYAAPPVMMQAQAQAPMTMQMQAPQMMMEPIAGGQMQMQARGVQLTSVTGQSMFDTIDRNHDGVITRAEFQSAGIH